MRADVRSGLVHEKTIDNGPPSEIPNSAARSEPTASRTARISAIRSAKVGGSPTGSESPVPRLSKTIRRLNEARRFRNWLRCGSSHATSRWETKPWTSSRSSGPSPRTW